MTVTTIGVIGFSAGAMLALSLAMISPDGVGARFRRRPPYRRE
jgi:predicted esterase